MSPPVASRAIGYTSVACYEAVVDGMPRHRSLGGQLNGLGPIPAKAPGEYHWPTVANAAIATVMQDLFAAAPAGVLTGIANREASFEAQFQSELPAGRFQRSVLRGEAIAQEIIAWAASDGYATWNNCAFTPPVGPGLWEPTPPGFAANPLQPCWGNMRTFALLYSAECAPLPCPPYSTSPTSAFFAEALEVRDVGDNLTSDQQDIARFWADGGGTGTPPGHWVSILEQVCVQQALTLDVAAEAFAKVGVAVADAFISCWEMKYYYNVLRPITYIQDPAGIDDPTWTSFITTPPFPEFTSGHSTQSGAAALVLTDLLGAVAFTDDTHAGTWPARSFASFFQAADEAAISRLYGGIHYRAAIERGVEQGWCIGQVILDHVEFREDD
jgi:hypothetical protein